MTPRRIACVACLCLVTSPAAAGTPDEFVGTRALGMAGANRGIGTSNDAIFLNPGGLATSRRYHIDVSYAHRLKPALGHVSLSALDSKSGPVAGAVAYTRDRSDLAGGRVDLHRFYGAVGYGLARGVGLGVSVKHLRGSYTDRASGEVHDGIDLYSGDIGVSALLGESVGLGISYRNAFSSTASELTRRTLGLGVAIATSRVVVALDGVWHQDERRQPWSLHLGGEALLGPSLPLRLGISREPFVDKEGVRRFELRGGGGIGWVNPAGGIHVAFAQSFERPRERTIALSLQVYL